MTLDEIRASLRQLPDSPPRFIEPMIIALEELMPSSDTVLETGSGLSTIWLAKNFAQIDSWEHLPDFAYAVQERLVELGITNATLHFGTDYAHNQLWALGESEYDIVILDGDDSCGSRVAAMQCGWQYVRPGGVLFIDDTERPDYAEGIKALDALGWFKRVLSGTDPYGRSGEAIQYSRP
jgi:predicted O-methyltransferase YrrM